MKRRGGGLEKEMNARTQVSWPAGLHLSMRAMVIRFWEKPSGAGLPSCTSPKLA